MKREKLINAIESNKSKMMKEIEYKMKHYCPSNFEGKDYIDQEGYCDGNTSALCDVCWSKAFDLAMEENPLEFLGKLISHMNKED